MKKATIINNDMLNLKNIEIPLKTKQKSYCDFLNFAATNFIIEGAHEYREIGSNKLITAEEIYKKFTEE